MYNSLRELQDAYESGELDESHPLFIDNDDTFVYLDDECVFGTHPDGLLEEALSLLGIPWEWV